MNDRENETIGKISAKFEANGILVENCDSLNSLWNCISSDEAKKIFLSACLDPDIFVYYAKKYFVQMVNGNGYDESTIDEIKSMAGKISCEGVLTFVEDVEICYTGIRNDEASTSEHLPASKPYIVRIIERAYKKYLERRENGKT